MGKIVFVCFLLLSFLKGVEGAIIQGTGTYIMPMPWSLAKLVSLFLLEPNISDKLYRINKYQQKTDFEHSYKKSYPNGDSVSS